MTNETPKNSGEHEVKHPWLAVLLSTMFPGAGQIYFGAKARGVFFIIFNIVLSLIIVFAFYDFLFTEDAATSRTYALMAITTFLVMLVLSIYIIFDAYRIAKRHNEEYVLTTAAVGNRKPWLAAFLSSFIPGIGQFYNRQVVKGLAFVVMLIVAHMLEDAFAPLFIFGLLVYLFGIKDAYDSAEALNGSHGRFSRQERSVVLFMVIMISLQEMPFAVIIKNHVIEAFKMPSGSMYPTLKIGDHFLIGRTTSFRSSLKRGDVVVFPYPANPKKNFIKRVIGLGGDKVQIINGDLYINDLLIPTTLIDVRESDEQPFSKEGGSPTVYEERIGDASYRIQYLHDKSATSGGPWLVPPDAVFVMGDNRDNSQDSRFWGPVLKNSIMGKAMKIYWSWDRADAKVRWERIGETIH